MRYSDGREVRPGDRVLWGGREGKVVLSVETGEAVEGFSLQDWAGLIEEGVLISISGLGLVHCFGQDDDLVLLHAGEPEV
ncbi:hypothetical protein M3484_04455 [Pseudomonas sp. GX19020]|uniref:hypothetical protein n=1 Tax=Pseudomonas sp. GX19020 TaxID=2942277 RepID=UPI002019E9E4|nr:hypothetical protein [Pseudomonas sp. GX19020]MCL4065815.1 hypothetical protein [Pseudomonas sp. GX19020]